jgi:hypothetical protein
MYSNPDRKESNRTGAFVLTSHPTSLDWIAEDWGSRGRGFKSRRPDSVRVSAGQKLAGALFS